MNADIKKEISIKEELAGKDDNITQESENVSAVKQEPRFIASKMNEGSGEIAEKNDPYAYLSRNEFSSELFKIEINNLPKYFGVGQLKKFMTRLGVNSHKIKLSDKSFVFVTFKCEADRQEGMTKLQGVKFKGSNLSVQLAKPLQDPLIRKRKAEEEENEADDVKKVKIVEPVEVQIKKATAPYAEKPYSEQLELKKNRNGKLPEEPDTGNWQSQRQNLTIHQDAEKEKQRDYMSSGRCRAFTRHRQVPKQV